VAESRAAHTTRLRAQAGPEDAASAQAVAKRSGRRVEISGLTTETTQVFANPSGTFSSEQSAVPVRVRRSGAWLPVDTTLKVGKNGMAAPAATPTEVAFSNRGDGPLVRMSRLDKKLVLGWPGPLPKPVLAGDTAKYRGVLPDVDLQLWATRDGFSQVLIVRSRAAAENPALRRIRFTTQTKGLSLGVDAGGTSGGGRGPRRAVEEVVVDEQVLQPVPHRQGSAGVAASGRWRLRADRHERGRSSAGFGARIRYEYRARGWCS